jgi:hypothetical protein
MIKSSEIVIDYFKNRARNAMDDSLWSESARLEIVSIHETMMYEHERYGTECPVCKKPWIKTSFGNRFGNIEYFQPDCKCMPRCAYCGRIMIIELALKLPDCMTCFYTKVSNTWALQSCGKIKAVTNKGRYGKEEGGFKKCEGFMKLVNRQGEYACDVCFRKEKRIKL